MSYLANLRNPEWMDLWHLLATWYLWCDRLRTDTWVTQRWTLPTWAQQELNLT